MTIAVIGGGAAGMAAALAAASRGAAVTVFERQARVGRKLAVTGNGRCNLTNRNAAPTFYHGGEAGFAAPALHRFDPEETLKRFRNLGLLTVTEPGGRVYPLSDTAGTVVDVLRHALEGVGVHLRLGAEVGEIRREKGGFSLLCGEERFTAQRVIVACGGAAGGKYGGTALGYRLLERLGHRCSSLRPGLVQLRSDSPWCRSLKGVRADTGVTLLRAGTAVGQAAGEVQFTDYGLSGPAIFEISREALAEDKAEISLDLVRELDRERLTAHILAHAQCSPQLTLGDALVGTVQNRLGRVLVSAAGLSQSVPITALDGKDAARLAAALKDFRFSVTGSQGMENAQVTVGGILTRDFDAETMESRLCPGLYACGEVLDVDGDCGGFNLQWAWSSGLLAGFNAAGDKPC